jgi:hypothetical protein
MLERAVLWYHEPLDSNQAPGDGVEQHNTNTSDRVAIFYTFIGHWQVAA